MSRLARRPAVDHTKAAARLRANPGKWLVIGEYRSSQSAEGVANTVRTAYVKRGSSPYAPAGSFQARTRLTEFGAALWVCYVGGAA